MSVNSISLSNISTATTAKLESSECNQQAEKADLIRQQHFLRPGDHIVFCGSCQDWKSVFLEDQTGYYKKYHNSAARHYIQCPTCEKYIHSIEATMFNTNMNFKEELKSFCEKKFTLIKK